MPGTQPSNDHKQCHFIFILIPELGILISALNRNRWRSALGPTASAWLASGFNSRPLRLQIPGEIIIIINKLEVVPGA